MEKLIKGVAYHGNRMLSHIHEDMKDIVEHGFNAVLHMFSHNDWDRHKKIMKEIIEISESYGLEVWVDNWGLGGPPGDKSHFLAYHPEAHQYLNNGEMASVYACYNHPAFVQFTKDWIDTVVEIGGKRIFWDEPHLQSHDWEDGKPARWACRCETCQALYKEKYGKEMPAEYDETIAEFRLWSVATYFKTVTEYAKEKGIEENAVCVMLDQSYGINLDSLASICGIDSLDNIGSDPYWPLETEGYCNAYEFVYPRSKQNIDVCAHFGKKHNVWIRGYAIPSGREEAIIAAADAIYDSGARSIWVWGFRGCEGNDYRAVNPDLTWKTVGDAMNRITNRYYEELHNAHRRDK